MDTLALINQIRNDGCSIVVNGTYLDISPADRLKPELIDQIKYNKTEILCVLYRENELKRLVNLVCSYYGFSREKRREILLTALKDQVNSITYYAAFAHKAGFLCHMGGEEPSIPHDKHNHNPTK